MNVYGLPGAVLIDGVTGCSYSHIFIDHHGSRVVYTHGKNWWPAKLQLSVGKYNLANTLICRARYQPSLECPCFQGLPWPACCCSSYTKELGLWLNCFGSMLTSLHPSHFIYVRMNQQCTGLLFIRLAFWWSILMDMLHAKAAHNAWLPNYISQAHINRDFNLPFFDAMECQNPIKSS